MPDDPAEPDNELRKLLRELIAAAAVDGAKQRAQWIAELAGLELDSIKDVLLKNMESPGQPVTVTLPTARVSVAAPGGHRRRNGRGQHGDGRPLRCGDAGLWRAHADWRRAVGRGNAGRWP